MLVAAVAGAQDPPKVSVSSDITEAGVGDTIPATLTVTFAPGLHGYQNPQKDATIIPIKVANGDHTEIVDVEYPTGTPKSVGGLPDKYPVYEGTIEIPFSFQLTSDPGPDGADIRFSYQQCNDSTCFPPDSVTVHLKLNLIGATSPDNGTPSPTTGTTDEPNTEKLSTSDNKESGGLAGLIRNGFATGNWIMLIGVLFLVGLSINLTPCVYPLIPITIGFFSSQAKDSMAGRAKLGGMYVLGIALTYGFIGGLAAVGGKVFGELFTNVWFNIALGVLMFGLALSMFDVYQIGLPNGIAKHLKGRSGAIGALVMGLLVGVGAAPCAGPLIISVFTEVAKLNNAFQSIASFVIVGLGLGLPYFILALLNNSTKSLPRAGNWMKLVKAGLGVVVMYFGAQYLFQGMPNIATPGQLPLLWTMFYVGAAICFVVYERSANDPKSAAIRGIAIALCAFMAGSNYAEYNRPVGSSEVGMKFEHFTKESWESAKQSGKPIFIDAGANWCVKCKEIEAGVFNKPEAAEASKGFVLLRIDWSTGVDDAYKDYTGKLFDIKGLPHMVVTKPGGTVAGASDEMHNVNELKEFLAKGKEGG